MRKQKLQKFCLIGDVPSFVWASNDKVAQAVAEYYGRDSEIIECSALNREPSDWAALHKYRMSRVERLIYDLALMHKGNIQRSPGFRGLDVNYPVSFFWIHPDLEPMLCYISNWELVEETRGSVTTSRYWKPTVDCFIDGVEVTDLFDLDYTSKIDEAVVGTFTNMGRNGSCAP